MKENSSDTLTSIEVKVLYHRYGIQNLSEHDSLRVLRLKHGVSLDPLKSHREVARQLHKNTDLICETEHSALRKLRSSHQV